jgi:hypothetical protein
MTITSKRKFVYLAIIGDANRGIGVTESTATASQTISIGGEVTVVFDSKTG